MAQERNGCLPGFLQRLFGAEDKTGGDWPYRVRDDWLSPAELSFLGVLKLAAQDRFLVCPKVGLKDIFFVVRPNENRSAWGKIAQKHVDFLLCNPATFRPLLGIELDDASHQQVKRAERDRFVDEVFKRADLPLLRVPAKRSYEPQSLMASISEKLGGGSVAPAAHAPVTQQPPAPAVATQTMAPTATIPLCPKCSVPMVLRTAKRGQNKDSQFYGCPNYPNCREIVPAPDA